MSGAGSFAFVVKDRETDLQCMRLRLTIWTMNPKDPETFALKAQADDLARAAVIEQRPHDGERIDGLIQLLQATEPWAFRYL